MLLIVVVSITRIVTATEQRLPTATILETKVLCKQLDRYIGWPSITTALNGDLIAVFSGDRATHVSPDGKTQMIRSIDGGKRWSEPVTIHDFPIDDRDAGIILTKQGTLIVSWFTGPPYGTKLEGHYVMRSTDDGLTWGKPIRTGVTSPHGPIVLTDGRLLYIGQSPHCSHGRPSDYNGPPSESPYSISVEESYDDGRSWSRVSEFPIPENAHMLSYDEPHIVETQNNQIVVLFRDCNPPNRLIQSESSDGGRTWSKPHPTQIHGYPAHLLRLKNGWILATYGRRWEPFGQFASISKNQCKTWLVEDEVRVLRAIVQVAPVGK